MDEFLNLWPDIAACLFYPSMVCDLRTLILFDLSTALAELVALFAATEACLMLSSFVALFVRRV